MDISIVGVPPELIASILTIGIIGVSISTVIGFIGRLWWPLDLFSHFRAQYLVLLIAFTGLAMLIGSSTIFMVGIIFTIINMLTIVPYYLSRRQDDNGKIKSRILLANVLRPNKQYRKLRQFIQKSSPDIIVLIEISEKWMIELDSVLTNYKHQYTALRNDNYGMAILSRHVIANTETCYFSDAEVPSLVVDIYLDDQQLTMIATHPPPPKSKIEHIHRNQQIKNLVNFLTKQKKPTILLGDFNTTSWSPYFLDLIRDSGLRDSRLGFGIQPTWPADKPIFMVPIDHVLVSDEIYIHDRFTGPFIGSDHRPVVVDFSI